MYNEFASTLVTRQCAGCGASFETIVRTSLHKASWCESCRRRFSLRERAQIKREAAARVRQCWRSANMSAPCQTCGALCGLGAAGQAVVHVATQAPGFYCGRCCPLCSPPAAGQAVVE